MIGTPFTDVHPPAGPKPVVCVVVNGEALVPERIDGLQVHFPKDPTHDVHIQVRLVVKRGDVEHALRVLAAVGAP